MSTTSIQGISQIMMIFEWKYLLFSALKIVELHYVPSSVVQQEDMESIAIDTLLMGLGKLYDRPGGMTWGITD